MLLSNDQDKTIDQVTINRLEIDNVNLKSKIEELTYESETFRELCYKQSEELKRIHSLTLFGRLKFLLFG